MDAKEEKSEKLNSGSWEQELQVLKPCSGIKSHEPSSSIKSDKKKDEVFEDLKNVKPSSSETVRTPESMESSPGLVEAQPDFEKSINSDSGPPTCCHCGALLYGPVAEGDTIKRLCLDCRDKKVEDFINLDGRLDSIEATLDTLYDRSFTVDERLNQINERTEAGTVSILRHLDSILSLAKQARVDSVDTLKSAIITESTVSNLDCWLKPICESMASFILRTDDIVAIKHMLVVLLDRYPCESGDGCGDSYGA